MALIVSPTYRNLTSANGRDHVGWAIVTWALALEASGFWRRKYQGDGVSVFSSGTANIFTANTVGYKTSGAWGAGVGGANSITNPKAYIVMEEVVGGVATGRQAMIQRGTGTTVGTDRNVIQALCWEPMTGSPAFATAPTAPAKSYVNGTGGVNGAGDNSMWHNLATSPQMGGSGGTMALNIFVADAASGTTGNVCPFGMECYDTTADDIASGWVYEALNDAPVGHSHPCVVFFPNVTTITQWEFGQAKTDNSNMFGQGSSVAVKCIDPSDNATVVNAAIMKILGFAGNYPNSSVAANVLADVDGKFLKLPAQVYKWAAGFSLLGVCETIEHIPGDSAVWPDTFHTAIADAVEPPRCSWTHTTMPWEVGLARTGLASAADHTNVRRVLAYAPTPDVVAPVIGAYSPVAGAIAYTQAITIPISDNLNELDHFEIWAEFAAQPDERVWSGNAFSSDYSTSTGLTGGNVIIVRDAGWPGSFTLKVRAWDADGNVSSTGAAAYTITTSPNPAALDTTNPTIGAFSPAAGAIAYTQAITIPLSDDRAVTYYLITAQYAGQPDETVWDGSAFSSDYSTSSALSAGNVVVRRDAGWPAGFTLRAQAKDAASNSSSSTAAYTITTSPNPAALDSTNPTIGTFSPAAGAIGYTQAITIPLSDDRAVAFYEITMQMAAQPDEVVWDGVAFSSDYSTSSALSAGNVVVRRDAGWPAAFTLRAHARDAAGNSSTTTTNYTITTSPNPAGIDVTTPTIGSISPAAGAIAYTQAITVPLSDDRAVTTYIISAEFVDQPDETIWNGSAFSSDYSTSSALSGGNVVVRRDVGWPEAFTLRVTAKDATNNSATTSVAYTLTTNYLPTVTSVSPASGSSIGIGQAISFRAADLLGLRVTDIWVDYPDGKREQIWDGAAADFSSTFETNSTRTVISAGKTFDFVIDRELAWYDDPVITIRLADTSGYVATTALSYTLNAATGPVLSSVSPVADTEIDAGGAVSFHIAGTSAALQLVTVTAEYDGFGFEVVHTGAAFAGDYTGSRTGITNGYAFSISKTGGWIADVTFHITAVDTDGRVLEESVAYTVDGAADGGAPTVGPFSPVSGTPITRDQSISFPVVDNSGAFALIVITAFFATTGAWEVVWLKDRFAPWYSASSRAPVDGGHNYVVRRSFGGWEATPTLIVEVVDATGVSSQ